MARAKSVSLSKLTARVQSAVKAAVRKHPKFSIDPPVAISTAYLIRGIPVPEAIAKQVTVTELQAYANTLAKGIGERSPGAVLSVGGHLIIGIPVIDEIALTK